MGADGNNDGRMSLSKKSSRMPGTKQCPSCRNTIAAAVAKCPKCPHIFREKKEKVKRSGKRGKKNCPKCKYENPSACSSCKQCQHIFRLKLMDKYKTMRQTMRPAQPATGGGENNVNQQQQQAASTVTAIAIQAAAVNSMHGQEMNVNAAMTAGSVSGGMQTASMGMGSVAMPTTVGNPYNAQFSQAAMHAVNVNAHGMAVMQPLTQPLTATHALTLPSHSHGIHPNNMAQMQQQIPQHPMQSHQTHPQM